jgi:hypothetical protein
VEARTPPRYAAFPDSRPHQLSAIAPLILAAAQADTIPMPASEGDQELEMVVSNEVDALLADTKAYPFARQIYPEMVTAINNGDALDLPSAYVIAMKSHPELR